jgi:ABC-2 type transport system permease protein
MLASMTTFEIRLQLRHPLPYVALILLVALGLFYPSLLAGGQSQGAGLTQINEPRMIANVLAVISLLAAIVPLAFFSGIGHRDTDSGMHDIVRSTAAPMWIVLLGRFLGVLGLVTLGFLLLMVAYEIGCRMPWIAPVFVGPVRPLVHAKTFAVILLPNLIILGALFTLVSTLSRARLAAFAVLVVLIALTVIAQTMVGAGALRVRAGLINPLASTALTVDTLHWSNAERATRAVELSGVMLWNRLLWLGLALLGLTAACWRFGRREAGIATPAERRPADAVADAGAPEAAVCRDVPPDRERVVADTRAAKGRLTVPFATRRGVGGLTMLRLRLGFELGQLMRSWITWVLFVLVAFLCFVIPRVPAGDMPVLPVAASLVPAIAMVLGLPMLAMAIMFGGEMIWRERQARIAEIADATPAPSAIFLAAKLLALALVLLAFPVIGSAIGLAHQAFHASPQLNISFYVAYGLLSLWLPCVMLALMAMLVHVVIESRFVGHLTAIALIVLITAIELLGYENRLVLFASPPEMALSDMNGLGHYLTPAVWFTIYWSTFSLLLLLAAHHLRGRGHPGPILARIKGWRGELTPAVKWTGVAALAAMASTGVYIYWNTRVLNTYDTAYATELRAVAYEKAYGASLYAPQPVITDVDVAIDLVPEERSYTARGKLELTNKTGHPLEVVQVHFDASVGVRSVEVEGGSRIDPKGCCVHVFRLGRAMAPGEKRALTYTVSMQKHGFLNKEPGSSINGNGTFINSEEFSPHIGVDRRRFLSDPRRRVVHGLAAYGHENEKADAASLRRGLFRQDSDFVRFAVTVSTSPDQIAVAPGYLKREWSEKGRRYFRYEMDNPIQNFWSVVSARYEVVRDRWGDVDLDVFHHPPHKANVERMLKATKLAFDYYSQNFGPYQHKQMRIVEFPYGAFAQSFPNTVPVAEMAGFISDPRQLAVFDVVTFLMAHEVAHQWWGHQLGPADVPGGNMLSESLAEYSALMVMEHKYGQAAIRRLLKFNLDRYLQSRGQGDLERPLVRAKANQGAILYQKGGLVMYALKEAMGEATVNRALARLIREHGLKSDPYASPDDLLHILREEASPAHHELISDLLEKITLWDLRAVSARATGLADGRWRVSLEIAAQKREADENGVVTERPLDQDIAIGLFTSDPRSQSRLSDDNVVYLKHHRIVSGRQTIELIVDRLPTHAGINPHLTLIQREAEATIISVSRLPASAALVAPD